MKRSIAVFLIVAAGCSSGARILNSYRAPGTVSFVFSKVAVVVLNGSRDQRAALEDEVVKDRPRLVAAHTILAPEDMRSVAVAKQKLLAEKFDGVVTMRLIRATEVNPETLHPGESFSSYAESAPNSEAPFGENMVRIETNIYELHGEKLIWAAIVEAPRSKNPKDTVRAAVDVMLDELRATGLVH